MDKTQASRSLCTGLDWWFNHELGLDRRETGSFYPTDEFDAATVIKVSTRGTPRSDTW